MSIKKFENFSESPKSELINKVDNLIKEGKNTELIVNFITDEIIADVRNKLGHVTSLIDIASLIDDADDEVKEFANSRLSKTIEMSKKVIEYIRSYNFDNKYKSI